MPQPAIFISSASIKKHPMANRLTIEQMDQNFQSQSGVEAVDWIDAFDDRLALRGLGWIEENRLERNFYRFPERAGSPFSDRVRELSHCPSGVFLSFTTNSANISLRMALANLDQMRHMPASGMAGAELFFRDGSAWIPAAVAIPPLEKTIFSCSLIKGARPIAREYRLYFPLYKKVDSLALGFDPGAHIAPFPAPSDSKPIFFYGTSITQGGCSSTAGADFVSTLGRKLDAEVINFGFSGNGKGEPEMARLIREIDAEMFVLDFAANADVATLETVLPDFIALLREVWPETPCVLMGNPSYNQRLWDPKVHAKLDLSRDTFMRSYLDRKKSGDRNVYFIDGDALLPAGVSGAYVDGVHPTSHGFALMAENLALQLQAIRLQRKLICG